MKIILPFWQQQYMPSMCRCSPLLLVQSLPIDRSYLSPLIVGNESLSPLIGHQQRVSPCQQVSEPSVHRLLVLCLPDAVIKQWCQVNATCKKTHNIYNVFSCLYTATWIKLVVINLYVFGFALVPKYEIFFVSASNIQSCKSVNPPLWIMSCSSDHV